VKVTYAEEAVADLVEAITFLNERSPTAAANLDAEIAQCIERLADREFEGPVSRLRSGAVVRSWGVPPVSDLLPAPSRRTVDRACLSPGSPPYHALSCPDITLFSSFRTPVVETTRPCWAIQNLLAL
jgi:hypothetical protein